MRLGAYCFSASNKLDGLEGIRETKWQESLELYCEKTYDGMVEAQPGTRDGVLLDTREVAQPAAAYLGEIAGNEVLQVVLPDTVVEIEELAFYNCRKLSVIEFGSALETIGSDVFMNCRSLKQLRVRADIRGKTGVKAVLSRIPWEIQVDFAGEETASLLYPEYTESYDEIAPAHIFGRNITGEGFRARQQFQDGIVQFAGYDAIYPKVIAEESPLTSRRWHIYGYRRRSVYRKMRGNVMRSSFIKRQRCWRCITLIGNNWNHCIICASIVI